MLLLHDYFGILFALDRLTWIRRTIWIHENSVNTNSNIKSIKFMYQWKFPIQNNFEEIYFGLFITDLTHLNFWSDSSELLIQLIWNFDLTHLNFWSNTSELLTITWTTVRYSCIRFHGRFRRSITPWSFWYIIWRFLVSKLKVL